MSYFFFYSLRRRLFKEHLRVYKTKTAGFSCSFHETLNLFGSLYLSLILAW